MTSFPCEILVVDDTPNNLRLLSQILREAGYEVRSALNGKMAFASVQASPPDLILLDIQMPGLNGYELCQRLRQTPFGMDIPIIFISALQNVQDRMKAFEVGGVDYILKPFYPQEVLARVQIHLTVSQQQRHLKAKNLELQREVERRRQVELLLYETNQELERLSNLDGLTQLANRRRFDQYLWEMWQLLQIDHDCLSLILCDVDFFKRYNDAYGHPAGDRCLQHVAQALLNGVHQATGLTARYGGEEFAVILPNASSYEAQMAAERIRNLVFGLELEHIKSPLYQRVTLSLGVSTLVPEVHISPQQLIAKADAALYAAKTQGRNQVVVWTAQIPPGGHKPAPSVSDCLPDGLDGGQQP